MTESNAIRRLTVAVQMLSEARDLDDIMRLREMAQVAEQYAKAEKLGDEAVQYAQEIRVRAARKAGEVLRDLKTEGRLSHVPITGPTSAKISGPRTSLQALGIERNQSGRWQRMAAVPDDEFEAAVAKGWGETAIARGGPVRKKPATEGLSPTTKTNGYTLKQSLSGLDAAAVQVEALAEALDGGLLGDWSRLYDLADAQRSFVSIEANLPTVASRLKRALREWKGQAA